MPISPRLMITILALFTSPLLAADFYGKNFNPSFHDDLLKLASGKPIALGEVGTLPAPTLFDTQPRWAWFMVWTDFLDNANPPENIRAIYNHPRTLTR